MTRPDRLLSACGCEAKEGHISAREQAGPGEVEVVRRLGPVRANRAWPDAQALRVVRLLASTAPMTSSPYHHNEVAKPSVDGRAPRWARAPDRAPGCRSSGTANGRPQETRIRP